MCERCEHREEIGGKKKRTSTRKDLREACAEVVKWMELAEIVSSDGLWYRRFLTGQLFTACLIGNYMYCETHFRIPLAENGGHIDRLLLKFCGSKPQTSLAYFL